MIYYCGESFKSMVFKKIKPNKPTLFINFPKLVIVLLNLLMAVILLAILGGIIKTFLGLQLLFENDVTYALSHILLDVLIILAMVEVLRTVNGYLADGRVRVTFIVDTVLIVMLNEGMSLWFKGADMTKIINLILIILCLIVVRILAIRFSPDEDE